MPQVVLSWPLSVRTMTSQRTSGDLPDERGSLPLDIDDVHILLQGQIEAFIEHKTTIKCCSYLIWCVIIYYKFDSIEMYILQSFSLLVWTSWMILWIHSLIHSTNFFICLFKSRLKWFIGDAKWYGLKSLSRSLFYAYIHPNTLCCDIKSMTQIRHK